MNGRSVNGGGSSAGAAAGGGGGGGAAGAPASIEGLPPLPKSLSGLLNSSGGSWREIERVHAKKAMIQDDLRRARTTGGAFPAERALPSKPANLDAALALLRKEMVGLRQQDMSLLCQLWSLHESIQEYKGSCQEAGPGGIDNGYFDEDDEFYTESGVTPVETPDEAEAPPQRNGTSEDMWLHESFRIAI